MKKLAPSLSKVLAKYPLLFAYLFGSHATAKAGKRSDIDIAIYPEEKVTASQRFQLRLDVMGAVMDAMHVDKVDVVDLREAPLPLRIRAIQPARVLFSRGEKERVRFEVSTRSEYFDRLPLIQRSNKTAFARMAKTGLR